MCGITGFIDYKKSTSMQDLRQMTDVMHHRGPDGSGYERIEQNNYVLGFGHRRLSIIDLTKSGKQPMCYKGYWICFNGEVYNYGKIKKELEGLGHSFESTSDTEVVLQAFVRWGSSCVDKFIGMFAFVIYNTSDGQVFCCRDRAGVKPFFYYIKDGLFLFSSELKSFHQHARFEKKLNLASVSAFMQYGNVPTPHSIFENTYKLKPGHFLAFNANEILDDDVLKPANQKCYWNVYDSYNKPKISLSFDEAKNETTKILKSACDYRMVADVPVGVFSEWGLR